MKRNRQEWEAEVSGAVKLGNKEQAIKILDHDFLFAEVPDRLHILQMRFDLVASNEEKVAVLDKKFDLVASNAEKVAVLDKTFDLVASNEEKVAVLDKKFDLVASNEEKAAVLDKKFDLVASNEEKVAVLDKKFDLVASNEEKVAVLDKKFRLVASTKEKVAVMDEKFDLVASNEEKAAVLDKKFDLVASTEEKVAVLDKKFRLVASTEEKVAVLDEKLDLVASNEGKAAVLDKKFDLVASDEEKVAVLDKKLGILREMLATNNSNSLLFTKIELIAKLAPLVPDEHCEALNQESKRAAADLEHLQPFHGVAGGASAQAGGPQAVPLADKQYFVVGGTIKNSRRIKGIRATLYKRAETHLAFYPGEGEFATYVGEDLHVCAAFEMNMKAMEFQTFLEHCHLDSPLLSLKDRIMVQDEISLQTISRPRRVRLQDYDPTCTDSPELALSDLQASTTSIDSLVDLDSEEFKFQRLEDEKVFAAFNSRPYIMHLKPQSDFPALRKQSYNRLAATWVFHQNFDGLHTLDQLPGLAIRAREDSSKDNPEVIAGQLRTRVELLVEFRSAAAAESLHLKEGSTRIAQDQWATFVHVLDPTRFRECLAWKYMQTKKDWRDADTAPDDAVSDQEENCENLVPAAVVAADVAGAE